MGGKRKIFIIAGAVLAVAIAAPPAIVPFFFPWTEINCVHDDINIKTGKWRRASYLWFVRTREEIRDTSLSKALGGKTVDAADIGEWQRVNTFCHSCRHSPHYSFHAALHQARTLDGIFAGMSDAQKFEIAAKTMSLWQQKRDDYEAGSYIEALLTETLRKRSP